MNSKLKGLFMFCILCAFSFKVNAQTFDGYALYNLQNQNTTYLIDKDGNIAHTWSCSVACNYTVLLKENGNIVRGGVYSGNSLTGAAIGGMVQEIDPSGTVVWEYVYSNSEHCSHHDITLMPNGNVILTAWEVKSSSECTQAGVDNPATEQWPTHFVELEPDGAGSATIVWEWHMWDHLVQDVDNTKDNYGVVADHPELMDANLVSVGGGPGPGPGGYDWFHINGVDYNETLDQLVFSSRFTSEFYIIDHSTTTSQAASHSGGNSGMGGDFIYRWGNPSNYGAPGAQMIDNAVHDPRWIEDDGRPNGGFIQFFNNEGNSGNSAIDAIDPPVDGYNYTLTPGSAYEPSTYDWRHNCIVSHTGQGAHNTMSNGNVFVNVSGEYMYEVDASDNLIWQYNAGPTKAFRYECDHAGIAVVLGSDPCGLGSSSIEEDVNDLSVYPNPSKGEFRIDGISTTDENVVIQVFDVQGNLILTKQNVNTINLDVQSEGLYFISVNINNENVLMKKVSLIK